MASNKQLQGAIAGASRKDVFNLGEVLKDEFGFSSFIHHLVGEWSSENLLFYVEANAFKEIAKSKLFRFSHFFVLPFFANLSYRN